MDKRPDLNKKIPIRDFNDFFVEKIYVLNIL